MKLLPYLPLFLVWAFQASVSGQGLREAEKLLQGGKYPEAAAMLVQVPADQGEAGYAQWLRAVALQQAGQGTEALAACGAVPADSPWHRKARLLQARVLTDLKRFAEAETIYAEEAARALSPARKDELAGLLAAFADEMAQKPKPGETGGPPPDLARAAKLYQEALEVEFLTPVFLEATLFKLAASLQKLGRHQNALIVLNDYLVQFDKDWLPLFDGTHQNYRPAPGAQGAMGPALEKPRDAKRFLQPGPQAAAARLRVAESQLALVQVDSARKTAESLTTLQPAPDAATLAAAAWLRCLTFGKIDAAPEPPRNAVDAQADNQGLNRNAIDALIQSATQLPRGSAGDPAKQNEALRAFLTAWPTDVHAPEAARLIGENLLALGRTDEGAAALSDFIEGKGYQFDPALEANRRPDPASGLTPADRLARQKQEVFFRLAQLAFDRKQFAAAIAKWRDYTVNYPNGVQWAAAQQGIIDAEFQLGIAAVAAGDETLARERFDAFLTRYPLDERARQILFIYGQFAYAAAQVRELSLTENNPAAVLPPETLELFRNAMEQWSRLITKYPQSEEASLALYNTALILTEKLGRLEEGLSAFRRITQGQWAQAAKERVGILEETSLAISAPRVFRTNEMPQLAVSVRNLKKLKVSRYALDLEGWLRSAHRLGGLEKLDVDLIAPEQTWEVDVADFTPWRSIQQKIDVPFPGETGGACVIRVESGDWQATTLVVRSDIELLTEATRGELLVFALNARDHQPAAGATVLVSDGTKLIATGKTGADGVFRHRADALPDTVRAFVLTPQGAMVSGLDLAALTVVKQPGTATHTTFDRDEYLPGQTARFVILRHRLEAGKAGAETGGVTLRVLAPDDRLVMARSVAWTADGSIADHFIIPGSAPDGEYKVQLLDPAGKMLVRAPFTVLEQPEDNEPRLSLKLDRAVVQPGGKIRATLFADWPWGLPVADEEVEIAFPDGKTGRRRTDAEGRVVFEITATSGTDAVWRPETVSVGIPSRAGAGRINGFFNVTTQDWSLALRPAAPVVPAGGTLPLQVRALRYDGTPAAQALQGTLYRLTALPPSRVLEGVPWINYTPPAAAEEKVADFSLTTNADTGTAVHELKPAAGGHYVVRLAGDGGKVQTEHRFYVSGGEDPHGLRLYAAAARVDEGSTQILALHSLKAHRHVLVTVSSDRFLTHQIMAVSAGKTDLPVPVTVDHAPNYRVTAAVMDGPQLTAASAEFTVRRGLKVVMNPAPDAGAAPGIAVTDLSGKPVAASLLGALVRTSPDPDALAGDGVVRRPGALPAMQVPRDLRLAVHTSAALMFPGTSVRVNPATGAAAETKVAAANDQQRLISLNTVELSDNKINSMLFFNNKRFAEMNCFVQMEAPRTTRGGALLFAEGVRRSADRYLQSPALPAIPDAVETAVLDPAPEATPPAPSAPQARLFTVMSQARNAIQTIRQFPYPTEFDPPQIPQTFNAQSDPPQIHQSGTHPFSGNNDEAAPAGTGSSDGMGTGISWSVVKSGPPVFEVQNLKEGRWLAVVRAWSPVHGMVEANLPMVRWKGPDVPAVVVAANPTVSAPMLWAHAGGVIQAAEEVGLNLPGIQAGPMAVASGRIFRTPVELIAFLGGRQGDNVLPASELLARVTLIQRLRKGTEEQKQAAETLLPRCVDLVSELALGEENGGWAWGGLAISPDILTTAWTWWALHAAKQAGVTVSDKLKARVERFLTANYAGIPADDYDKKAAVLHAMAAAGLADYANAAPLLRVRDKLSECAQAFLAAALIRMERPEEARQLLQLLEARAERGKGGSTIATASWKGSGRIVRLSGRELITAMVLWCQARLEPASPAGAAAANWLLGSEAMFAEGGTHSLGPVAVALDAWFTGGNDWTDAGYAQFSTAQGPINQGGDTLEVKLPGGPGQNPFTILPRDGKRVIFSMVLGGAPQETTDPKPWAHPEIASRKFYHDTLLSGDEWLNAASTSPVQNVEPGQRVRVEVKLKSTAPEVASHPQYLVWEEPLPAGFVLVPGSLEGNWDRLEILPGRIRLTYGPGVIQPLNYQLVALVPGESRVAPSIIRDAYDSAKFRPGPGALLTVLKPGEKSPDPYEMNQAEHFELARRTFARGNSAECLKHLDALTPSARKTEYEKDLARMRLWLLTDTPDGDAPWIVQAFETLNERHPGLVVPFDRILRVGAAYQKIGEHERGAYVFSAALEAAFLTDSGISAVLEDEGDYAGSVDCQEKLWFDAPDSGDARGALFALSQSLFRKADGAEKLPVRPGRKKLEKSALLTRSRDLLARFLTLYPSDELADDAAFSLTNAYFALKDYPGVAAVAEAAAARFPRSTFLGQFQYMAALGHFWQFHYAEALASAAPVANGDSKDRDLARYITGQIHHAEGKPAAAVEWYGKVKAKYPDAADALAAFEEKKIGVPEIATYAPGAEVKLPVTHRNVKEVSLQIYKVDLMRLYLREKNLSRVTRVNLAGIAPEAAVPLDTAAAAAWTDHQATVTLPLKDEGAYLIIARGDDLFTSGLVLVTPLKLEVREDAPAGSVRVNVLTAADGKYVADAEVKAIASGSPEIQSGQTDPRGIFEATGLNGLATVIVRQGENRFAFHRGTVALTGAGLPVTPTTPQSLDARGDRRRMVLPTEFDPPQIPQSFGGKVLGKEAYFENMTDLNRGIQEGNLRNWDAKRRANGRGVQADKALKK